MGIICACLPTYAILFSKTILEPSKGSSRRGILSTAWSKLTRSPDHSERKAGENSLSDLPSRRGYMKSADLESSIGSKEAVEHEDFSDRTHGDLAHHTITSGPSDDREERPFAKLGDPQAIYHESTFSVTSELQEQGRNG